MAEYTFFTPETGEIQFQYSGFSILDMVSVVPELSYISGTYSSEDYFLLSEEVTPRPSMPISLNKTEILADGLDTLVISGIPVDSKVVIKNASFYAEEVVTTGETNFLTNQEGEYIIEIIGFPYVTFKGSFNAIS